MEPDGGFNITAYSKDDIKIVMDFYKKVLEGEKVNNSYNADAGEKINNKKTGFN